MNPPDRFGFVKPSVDAHVLGITSIGDILTDLGKEVVYAPREVCQACDRPEGDLESAAIEAWIRGQRISLLGFSYRLSPEDGVDLLVRLVRQLERRSLFADQGGPVASLFFAGLPPACQLARQRVPRLQAVFDGEETPRETLHRLGIRPSAVPRESERAIAYDSDRLAFGEDIVRRGHYLAEAPPERGGYPEYGTARETLAMRTAQAARAGTLPLYRAHMGQYLPDREEAVRLFHRWTRELAGLGQLDVLSIGTSQLSQERFGEDWGDSTNGGGVPLNSREEFSDTWRAARPDARPFVRRDEEPGRHGPDERRDHPQRVARAVHLVVLQDGQQGALYAAGEPRPDGRGAAVHRVHGQALRAERSPPFRVPRRPTRSPTSSRGTSRPGRRKPWASGASSCRTC